MIAVILPLSSFAQGVDFKSLTMKEAQAVAEKEKKMIFIDNSFRETCQTRSGKLHSQAMTSSRMSCVSPRPVLKLPASNHAPGAIAPVHGGTGLLT